MTKGNTTLLALTNIILTFMSEAVPLYISLMMQMFASGLLASQPLWKCSPEITFTEPQIQWFQETVMESGTTTFKLWREGRSDQEHSVGCAAHCAHGFDTASRGRRCSVSSTNLSRSLAPPLGLLCQVSDQSGSEGQNKAEVFRACYRYSTLL